MFRLSKITDYAIVLMAHFARGSADEVHTARDLASAVGLPGPVVSKTLKSLTREGLLESHRGSKGGYALTRRPDEISVAEMIKALEGPVSLTECSTSESMCSYQHDCAIQGPWSVINDVVEGALATVTLADLIDPSFRSARAPLHVLGQHPTQSGDCPITTFQKDRAGESGAPDIN